MFTVLTKPSCKPCRCRQRPWLRIAFSPVRRRSSLASCRIDLHAGRTKSYVKLYICEALEKDIDELFELIMNCPKTAELVSKMLAPLLREAG